MMDVIVSHIPYRYALNEFMSRGTYIREMNILMPLKKSIVIIFLLALTDLVFLSKNISLKIFVTLFIKNPFFYPSAGRGMLPQVGGVLQPRS
jgi:hypothetical protein